MSLSIQPSGAACGAFVTGVDLTQDISADLASELRAHWLEHKVLAFPDQALSDADLERFTLSFGEIGREPFFGSVDGHEHIIAIQRSADETTPVFAEFFHSDQSFMPVPPAGTCLFGITIPPVGGNTLFADQVKAYERLPDGLRERAEGLTAIHSADRVYTADGVYGDDDRTHGRSMDIIPDESARERCRHPFVRTHRETGEKALYSSPAFIRGYVDVEQDEADALMFEFYDWQTRDELVYSHKWSRNTLLMWDNRSVLHSASGGYDGHDRLLHRTTIADTRF